MKDSLLKQYFKEELEFLKDNYENEKHKKMFENLTDEQIEATAESLNSNDYIIQTLNEWLMDELKNITGYEEEE